MGIFFFFQAEDGIRDVAVTGVQTCALPIYQRRLHAGEGGARGGARAGRRLRGARPARRVRVHLQGPDGGRAAPRARAEVAGPRGLGMSALGGWRSEEHTSELQSRLHLVCRLLLEKKKKQGK